MDVHGVQVESIRALKAHNLHAYVPVLQIKLDIGPYEETSSADVPGFTERLLGWVPELQEHACSIGRPGGFVERLHRGTWLGHIVEHATIALQNRMGFEVSFGRVRGAGTRGVYQVVIEYEEEVPARAAFEVALRLVVAAMRGMDFPIDSESERLMDIADRHRLGPSTAAIVAAARSAGIPVLRITPTRSLVQLGYGAHQRLIQASETSLTSAIAVDLCQEKPLTNHLLGTVGVPVPEGRSVRSADEAWAAAQEIGVPVAIKPEAGNQGNGVSVGLRTEAEVRAAWELAAERSRAVLVERSISGADYRLLVVDGQMVAAARRDPAQVRGDGVSTVAELVAEANRDPRRRPGHGAALTRLELGEAEERVLASQDLSATSVPESGRIVILRTNCNLSTGGTATDVTDEVHPKNARLAELAADIVGLDIAGIDVMATDIGRPLDEQGGAVIEVNAAPGLRMHLSPAAGRPRNVGRPIVRMLFPNGAPSRIPIIAVTGTNGKTTVTCLVAHLFSTAKKRVGMTTTEGVYIGEERTLTGDCSGPRSAETVLRHPRVDVAVLETARGGILRAGLAFDACSVAVVTNVSGDHLGIGGVETVEDLARVKQVVVQSVSRDGAAVLNAEDRLCAEMAAATDARVVYFARKADHPVVAAHLASGGAAVYVENDWLVLHDGKGPQPLMGLARVPFTAGGRVGFQVENALAATAAAWASGLNPALIARGLSTFVTDRASVPGRFNRMEVRGIELVVDYAHNPSAMAALADAVQSLGPKRTIVTIGLPGDRRDDDLRDTISKTVPFANAWVLHDLAHLRNRAAGEVPQLMREVLPPERECRIVSDARQALSEALAMASPGERVVLIADVVDDLLEWLSELESRSDGTGGCGSVSETAVRSTRPEPSSRPRIAVGRPART